MGDWAVNPDATAATGASLLNVNRNAAKVPAALASPANYFEMTFEAAAGARPQPTTAPLVEDADRRVAGASDLTRGLQHPVEHSLEIELGDQRATDIEQTKQPAVIQGLAHLLRA